MSMSSVRRNRRWLAMAVAGAGMAPLAARAETGDDAETSYTSPELGMQVTWEAPWRLEDPNDEPGSGLEFATLLPGESTTDRLALVTMLISAQYADFEQYLDYFERYYSPENLEEVHSPDAVHILFSERTARSIAFLALVDDAPGGSFELFEHRIEDGDELATSSLLIVDTVEAFEDHFTNLQQDITFNGHAPFTVVNEREVIDLAANALDG